MSYFEHGGKDSCTIGIKVTKEKDVILDITLEISSSIKGLENH